MSITQTILDQLGLSRAALTVFKWIVIVGLLAATHGAAYYKGRVDKELDIAGANVEQIQEDAVDNAESIESQITRLNEATERLRRQAQKVEGAIDANQAVNLNPACDTSADELREFNEAISSANRGMPDRSDD